MSTLIKKHPAWFLAFGGLLISFAAVFTRIAHSAGMAAETYVFWRFVFGGVMYLLPMAVAQSRARGEERPKPSAQAWGYAAALGAWFTLDMMVWNQSVVRVGAGLSTLLGNTQVLWLGLFGVFLFREKAGPRFKAALPLAVAGVVAVSGTLEGIDPGSEFGIGVGYGVATGVIYATYLLILRRSGGLDRPLDTTVNAGLITLVAATCAGLWLLLRGIPFGPFSLTAMAACAGAGAIAQCAGWIVISKVLALLPASKGGVILLVQPVLAMVWGVVFFGESHSAIQIAGAVATLVGIWLAVTDHKRVKDR